MVELDEGSLNADLDVGAGDDAEPVIAIGHVWQKAGACGSEYNLCVYKCK